MSEQPVLPAGAQPFVQFPALLRANGLPVAPEQTIAFIAAVGLLGPRHLTDIHRAARATLAPPPEEFERFDALFRACFLGQTLAAPAGGAPDETLKVHDEGLALLEPEQVEAADEGGQEATRVERLGARVLGPLDDTDALRRFRRAAPAHLPRRLARRRRSARAGATLHLRRMLRAAARQDGEVFNLPRLRRITTQRRILLLIDVSGSMKAESESYLRFAHALAQAAPRLEVFTLGTRLTRISRVLRRRQEDQALGLAAGLVPDWDGGTRLGDALQALLAVPRYAGFARDALVLILSDGLERGEPAALIDAVRRLDRLAWRILWLSPLAGTDGYAPRTAALQAILPHVDRLGDAGSLDRLCRQVLDFAEGRRP